MGHVPDDIVRCVTAFMEFCYLARRPSHTIHDLNKMESAHEQFTHHRRIFEELDVRPTGFSLPRQHSLVHYVHAIKMFGSPNGLCSSITESKHIIAVKRPWRASSKNEPLIQILKTNVRISKLSAACTDFGHRGMLHSDVLTSARIELGYMLADDDIPPEAVSSQQVINCDDEGDVVGMDGPCSEPSTTFPTRHGKWLHIMFLPSNKLYLSLYSYTQRSCRKYKMF